MVMPDLLGRSAAIMFAATVAAMVATLFVFGSGLGFAAAVLVAGITVAIALPAFGAWVLGPVVAERERAAATLRRMAEFDGATGLPNRALLHDRLRTETARATRAGKGFSVLCVAFDGLAEGTRSVGHEGTDAVRRALAQGMMAAVRASDTVARLGDDSYAVLLADQADPQTATISADRIRTALTAVIAGLPRVPDLAAELSAGIGIACYPSHSRDIETLIRQAEAAACPPPPGVDDSASPGYRFAVPVAVAGAPEKAPVPAGDKAPAGAGDKAPAGAGDIVRIAVTTATPPPERELQLSLL